MRNLNTVRSSKSLPIVLVAAACLSVAVQARFQDPAAAPSVAPADPVAPPSRAVIARYCATCHNPRTNAGSLSLQAFDPDQAAASPEVAEKVLRKLKTGAMPPAGVPRPDAGTVARIVTSIEATLDADATAHPNPGYSPIHRLNRTEYVNAIRDLLDLEIDGRSFFPADDTGYGFDNIADVLSVSPMLIERYLSASQKISRLAIGDPAMQPAVATYAVGKYIRQEDRRGEDVPFGSRGGFAVRHYFPMDGDYIVKVYLDRTYTGQVRGLAEKHDLEVRLNGALVKQFEVGGIETDAEGNPVTPAPAPRETAAAAAGPSGKPAAAVAQPAAGGRRGRQPLTPEQQAENDRRAAEQAARLAEQANIAGQRAEQSQAADAHLFVRFPAKAGPGVLAVTFVAKDVLHEGAQRHPLMVTSYEYAGNTVGDPAVGSIDIRGPFDVTGRGDTPSRRRIFTCRPASAAGEERCARTIVSELARRAYRRPLTDGDVQGLIELYKSGRAGRDFEAGIESALRRILVSPDFLFRAADPPAAVPANAPYRLSDLQLASRLSFFLWSSIPDDELLTLASRDQLSRPDVYSQQIRRMLADPRARALVENFAGQWLFLRNLRLVTPDPYEFPDFDDNLREAFQKETELFLDSQIRGDRSVGELLNADYTFLNQRLAEHYGIPNVYGTHFRRVAIQDPMRRGLLGQGSILTVTSYREPDLAGTSR